MIEIFDIEDDKVKVNVNCLMIPELLAVTKKYEHPVSPLSYIYHKTSPKSAYGNIPESDKDEVLLSDFPGDYSPEDEEIVKAIEKMNFLYTTPTRKFFLNAKKGLETLGEYLSTAQISDGKDGNFAAFGMSFTRIGKIIQEFKQLEKFYEDESKTNLRGGWEKGYDE